MLQYIHGSARLVSRQVDEMRARYLTDWLMDGSTCVIRAKEKAVERAGTGTETGRGRALCSACFPSNPCPCSCPSPCSPWAALVPWWSPCICILPPSPSTLLPWDWSASATAPTPTEGKWANCDSSPTLGPERSCSRLRAIFSLDRWCSALISSTCRVCARLEKEIKKDRGGGKK